MDKMFGYLLGVDTNTAMVMGEFAGLYGKDAHPLLTTKRTTDFTIEVMLQSGYAGGYMWSLNPESAYQYNPADTYGTFTEGLLEDDWITPNKVFVDGIAALDEIKNLKMFPCFEVEMTSAAGSSILAGILQFVEAAAVSLAVLTASKPLSMEVRIVRPMPPKSSDIPSETGDDADRPSSYRNTEYTSGRASAYAAGDGSDSGRETMMSSRQTEMKLMAMDLSDGAVPERVQDYKGRIRTWRGLMLLCVILGGAAAIITTCALSASDAAAVRQARYENKTEER
uniref:Glycoside hydrolase family 5 domain-containing protein n=1 Tax=Phytophthora ramorum TaxID=164328 RepID=H3H5W6_PHYRM